MNSPWWTRAWTVQECISPKDCLLMFGKWTIDWDSMLKAEFMKNSHGDGLTQCCKEAVNAFNPYQLGSINEWMWHPSRGREFRDILRGKRSPPLFYKAILAFSSRQCSEPLDKIYSMLSLATHPVYQDLRPNYEESVSTVYTDVFTCMVRETKGNFDCFMGGGFGSAMPELPSWVRDFSQTRPLGVVAIEERRIWYSTLYRASVTQPIQPLWNENREFHYRGTYADTIKAVGPQFSTSDTVLREVFAQWLDLCRAALGLLCTMFSRIICSDVCKTLEGGPEFRRARETDFPAADGWNQLINGNTNALDMRAYGWGLNFGAIGRCFFITYSGRMGMCYPNTLAGDEIWIMRGAQVSFIVRPREPAGAGCASTYSLLGDCFLNGIMDGELKEKEQLMEQPIVIK